MASISGIAPLRRMAYIEKDPDARSRLRTGLNPDCLAKIFENLAISDLVTLSQMNKYYQQIICDLVIQKVMPVFGGARATVFGELDMIIEKDDVTYFFVTFGQYLRKFHFDGNYEDFQQFLQFIAQHCSREQFNEIQLSHSLNYGDSRLPRIPKAFDYFHNVEKFYVIYSGISRNWQKIHNISLSLLGDATELRSLRLNRYPAQHINLKFLQENPLPNLTELHLTGAMVRNVKCLLDFIKRRPRLERFINEKSLGPDDIELVGAALAKYCGETLHTFCNIHKEYSSRRHRHENGFKFLSAFENLRNVTLTSHCPYTSELYYPLIELAKRNTLEKLGICSASLGFGATAIIPDNKMTIALNAFTKLKTLSIFIYGVNGKEISIEKHFLFNNAKQLFPNIETLELAGRMYRFDPCQLVRLMPNLRRFSIQNFEYFLHEDFCPHLDYILELRNNGAQDSIELRFSETQANELSKVDKKKNIQLIPMPNNRSEFIWKHPYDTVFNSIA